MLAVRGMRQQGARSTNQQSNKGMSWKAADVRNGQHTEECRARIEQEMVDKGDTTKLETSVSQEEIVQEPDVSLKRKIGEPDSLTADTQEERICARILCRK